MIKSREAVDSSSIPQDALPTAKWLSVVLPDFDEEYSRVIPSQLGVSRWQGVIKNFSDVRTLKVEVSHGRHETDIDLELTDKAKETWRIDEVFSGAVKLSQVEVWHPRSLVETSSPLVAYRLDRQHEEILRFSFYLDDKEEWSLGTLPRRPSQFPLILERDINLQRVIGQDGRRMLDGAASRAQLRNGVRLFRGLKDLVYRASQE